MIMLFSILFVFSFILCLVVALNTDHFLDSGKIFPGFDFLIVMVAFVPILNTYAAIILMHVFYHKVKKDA